MYLRRLFEGMQNWFMEKQNIEDWAEIARLDHAIDACLLAPLNVCDTNEVMHLYRLRENARQRCDVYTRMKQRGRVMDVQA